MFKFDMAASLLTVMIAFSLGFFIMLFIWFKYRRNFSGITLYVHFFLFMTVGISLIIFRASLPTFISVILANSLLVTGRMMLLYGVSIFYKIKIRPIILITYLFIFILFFVIFTYIEPNVTARIIAYAVSSALIHLGIAIVINKNYKLTKIRTLMVPVNIIYGIYFVIRIFVMFITKESFGSLFDYNYDAFIILTEGLLGLLLLVGIYDMISNTFSREVIEAEKSKNRLLDNIPGFAYRCLFDKDWTMLLISKAFEDITGYSTAEVIRNKEISYNNIIAKEYREKIWEGFRLSISEFKEFAGEYEIIKKNGERIWVWEQGKGVYDEKGKLLFIEGLITDITKRKQDEAELSKITEENKFLEENIRNQQRIEAVAVLAGGVAHEINNPINGIMNYGQLIVDSASPNSAIKEYASEIIQETDRVSKIVKNLLKFAGKDLYTISSITAEDIINSTLSLIKSIMKKENISLKVKIERNLPEISCNSQQIQQVLMSILINSRENLSIKEDGQFKNKKINITCEKIEVDTGEFIKIMIEDNGSGIPESIHDRIFNPFFTTKSRAVAMGLGLSTSYKIIKNHNGNIYFETKENEYTRFFIELPIKS